MSSNDSKPTPTFGERGAYLPALFALPIALIAVSGVWALRGRSKMVGSLTRGEGEGRAFAAASNDGGKKRSASDCLDGALDAMDAYEEPREPSAAAFFEGCLSSSSLPLTTGAKHSAPTRGALETWTRDECASRGRAGDARCSRLMQLVNLDPCASTFSGQAHAPPAWSCGNR